MDRIASSNATTPLSFPTILLIKSRILKPLSQRNGGRATRAQASLNSCQASPAHWSTAYRTRCGSVRTMPLPKSNQMLAPLGLSTLGLKEGAAGICSVMMTCWYACILTRAAPMSVFDRCCSTCRTKTTSPGGSGLAEISTTRNRRENRYSADDFPRSDRQLRHTHCNR